MFLAGEISFGIKGSKAVVLIRLSIVEIKAFVVSLGHVSFIFCFYLLICYKLLFVINYICYKLLFALNYYNTNSNIIKVYKLIVLKSFIFILHLIMDLTFMIFLFLHH